MSVPVDSPPQSCRRRSFALLANQALLFISMSEPTCGNSLAGGDAVKILFLAGKMLLIAAHVFYKRENSVSSAWSHFMLLFRAREKRSKHVMSMKVFVGHSTCGADNIGLKLSRQWRKTNFPHPTTRRNYVSRICLCRCTETQSLFQLLSIGFKRTILDVDSVVRW